MGALVG